MNRQFHVLGSALVGAMLVQFAPADRCIAVTIELGTYSIQGVFELSIQYDSETQTITKKGSVLGHRLNKHATGVERVYGSVYHLHDKEVFEIGRKQVAGIKWNVAVDAGNPKVLGFCIRIGYPDANLFKRGLRWKTKLEKNWPDAIEEVPLGDGRLKGRLEAMRSLEGDDTSVLGAITAHAGYLYWFDSRGNRLRRAKINGDGTLRNSEPVTDANDPAFADPSLGIAVSNGELFYFDTRKGRGRQRLRGIRIGDDGHVTGRTFAVEGEDGKSSVDAAKGVVVATLEGSRYLYYWDNRKGGEYSCVRRAKIKENHELDTTSQIERRADGEESSIGGCLAESDGYLYWWDIRPRYRSIRRAKLNKEGLGRSEEVETPPSSVDYTKGIGISPPYFYWFDTDEQQLVVGTIQSGT